MKLSKSYNMLEVVTTMTKKKYNGIRELETWTQWQLR